MRWNIKLVKAYWAYPFSMSKRLVVYIRQQFTDIFSRSINLFERFYLFNAWYSRIFFSISSMLFHCFSFHLTNIPKRIFDNRMRMRAMRVPKYVDNTISLGINPTVWCKHWLQKWTKKATKTTTLPPLAAPVPHFLLSFQMLLSWGEKAEKR